jgi:tripartite-type tricarboxylate transporter receptor subunit TctC
VRYAGTTDILARLIGQRLSEQLGQSFIVENRPGASTMIGTEAVVRVPADGYAPILAYGERNQHDALPPRTCWSLAFTSGPE